MHVETDLPSRDRARCSQRTCPATIQLDVVEAETEEITQGNTLLRARRTTKRLSVTSLPSGLQKFRIPQKRNHAFQHSKKRNIARKTSSENQI
ncbi:putative uncharacterized protein C3orf49 homolog [Sagmatias obliquidens]|uniref:putative uncharacterized protein C3orf49 homolog n=1 Tax=Sagmatias obliquidens TaxID=3371155 RepID=UPI000F443AA3|nr:putative uncharacterized protein C3orf49 homolog [Lagenorhynchus obliquidens]